MKFGQFCCKASEHFNQSNGFFGWRHMSQKSELEAPMDGCQWRGM